MQHHLLPRDKVVGRQPTEAPMAPPQPAPHRTLSRRRLFLHLSTYLLPTAAPVALMVGASRVTAQKRRPARPLRLLINVDVSDSQSPSERRESCKVIRAVGERVFASDTLVVLRTFVRDARTVYQGRPREALQLRRALKQEVIDAPRGLSKGTSPASALAGNLAEARRSEANGQDSCLLLWWDGEDFQPRKTKALVAALARLSSLKAVWVAGVPTGSEANLRQQVERNFRTLGDRLIVTGPYDAREGLEKFLLLLRGG